MRQTTLQERLAYRNRLLPYAEQLAAKYNVHPNWIIGQMALETNWGASVLPGTNNHGNVLEVRKNVPGVTASDAGNRRTFRKFANDQEFFNYYDNMLGGRYKGVTGAPDAYQFGQALLNKGYAENKNYARDVAAVSNAVNKLAGDYQWQGKPTTTAPTTMQALAGQAIPQVQQAPVQQTPVQQQYTHQPPAPQHGAWGAEILGQLFGDPNWRPDFWRTR